MDGRGSYRYEEVLHITQSSRKGTPLSDVVKSHIKDMLRVMGWRSYSSTDVPSAYSTVPTDWA